MDSSKFLDTEELIYSLVNELEKYKSAAQQLDQAKAAAVDMIATSQNLTNWAEQLLEKGGSQLEATLTVAKDVDKIVEQFKQSQEKWAEQLHEIHAFQGEETSQIEAIQERQGKLQSLLADLQNNLHENQTTINSSFQTQEALIRDQGDQQQSHFDTQSELITQQENRLQAGMAELASSLEEIGDQQKNSFQEQVELIHQQEEHLQAPLTQLQNDLNEKVLSKLASLEGSALKSAKMVNILLIVSVLNALAAIALLALKLTGR